MSLRLGIHGASGAMGRALIRLAPSFFGEGGAYVAAAVATPARVGTPVSALIPEAPDSLRFSNLESLRECDVIIDFSLPEGARALFAAAPHLGRPIVSGTTGLSSDELERLRSANVPTLFAANFSVGVAVLKKLVTIADGALGDFDVELVETHHSRKVDSPSGTALSILDALRREQERRFGREGSAGPRPQREVGVHAIRGGDVVGEHTLTFFGVGERIELAHRATDRDIFARGALRCASWLKTKPPGDYSVEDALFSS